MRIKVVAILIIGLLVFACNKNKKVDFVNKSELTNYVDPFIGTGGHGHTYPGAVVPFGMVQLSPDTRVGNWDACSGYHYSDSTIIGFSHQHLSGTGCIDYGDVLFMPTVGKIQLQKGDENNTANGYRSKFMHSTEIASPGYYSVILNDYNIRAELTATARAGFHKYTFPENEGNLIIDLVHNIEPAEKIKKLEFEIIDSTTIKGLRITQGWAEEQVVYFYAQLSKSIIEKGIYENDIMKKNSRKLKSDNIKAYLKFNNLGNEPLLIKVGISAVDYEGAKNNLLTEIPDWDFDKVKESAKKLWNDQLNKIVVKDKSEENKIKFYTGLYHSSLFPNIYFDVDRRYRGNDKNIHICEDFDNYTTFSLWDTFRATNPLFTIIDRERTNNIIRSMLAIYKESGFLPKWELAGNETGTMIGYHAVSVITDAYTKGITDFDTELALEAMIKSANNNINDLNLYKKYGYIPSDKGIASVSKTLEYAYDDWCIYKFAKAIGKEKIAEEYQTRAKNYENVFDGGTGFFRGKKSQGNWDEGFNPFEISRNYTEANAWQYSLFVPHDVNGLINLYGSKENVIKHLDEMFTFEKELSGHDIPDITGLIGQYAQGNEPSHHVAYLYNYLNQPWKTQERIRQINKEQYTTEPDGLSGNEDCGQMSSWFNFSSIGFYPFCPGTEEYQIGAPLFEEAIINLENGKQIKIIAEYISDKNKYVQKIKLNEKILDRSFIKHNEIINGGKIEFVMGETPNKSWGINNHQNPYSHSFDNATSIPYLKNNVSYFLENAIIDLGCRTEGAEIRYTIDGSEPNAKSKLFKAPFQILKSTVLKAQAYKEGTRPGSVLSVNAEKIQLLAPLEKSNLVNGVNYKYLEGKYSSAYQLKHAKIIKTGKLENISLDQAEKEDHYGFIFEGYINIPKDNIYTFYSKSDDGSVLLIHNKEVVNNDGSHGAMSTSGIIGLKKGLHPFTLLFFEDYEGNMVEVSWASNTIKKELIPDKVLYR